MAPKAATAMIKPTHSTMLRVLAEAAAALAAPVQEDVVGGDAFDNLVETPESRDS